MDNARWKVPGRRIYCDSVLSWALETFHCHVWLKLDSFRGRHTSKPEAPNLESVSSDSFAETSSWTKDPAKAERARQ